MIAGRIGTLGGGANIGAGKMHSEGTRYTLPKIIMQEDLKVTIEEDLSGSFQMHAKTITIDLRDLLLQSLHDVAKSEAWQAGLAISPDSTAQAKARLAGISLSHGNSNRKWVSEIAEIIGTEAVTIVAARAVTLICATIATTQNDIADGDYDAAALKLKAAELFIYHLNGQDEGITLGAAFNRASPTLADGSPNPASDRYGIQFGAHDMQQMLTSTISGGRIEIAGVLYANGVPIPSKTGESAGRDVRHRLHEQTNLNIRDHWYHFSWVKDGKAFDAMQDKAQKNIKAIVQDPTAIIEKLAQSPADFVLQVKEALMDLLAPGAETVATHIAAPIAAPETPKEQYNPEPEKQTAKTPPEQPAKGKSNFPTPVAKPEVDDFDTTYRKFQAKMLADELVDNLINILDGGNSDPKFDSKLNKLKDSNAIKIDRKPNPALSNLDQNSISPLRVIGDITVEMSAAELKARGFQTLAQASKSIVFGAGVAYDYFNSDSRFQDPGKTFIKVLSANAYGAAAGSIVVIAITPLVLPGSVILLTGVAVGTGVGFIANKILD